MWGEDGSPARALAAQELDVSTVTQRLAAAGCVAADEEARQLVTAASDAGTLESFVTRREQGWPLAWITGTSRFCGAAVHVSPGVYVPRVQSEELARRAGALLSGKGGEAWAADLCTGSGAVAAHLRAVAPAANVVAVDSDRRAVACARRNGVLAVLGDLGAPLAPSVFDVVTAVAPYVPSGDLRLLPADVQRFEPRAALDGGFDGLDLVRRVIGAAARLLRPGGWLLVEVGGGQDRLLGPTLDTCGFDSAASWRDDDGDLRGVVARRGAN